MRKLKNNELNRLNLEEFKKSKKIPLVIVLDNIRSAHNVGSVFRTSDAFLVEKICLCGITPIPPHKEIRKTASILLGSGPTVLLRKFVLFNEVDKPDPRAGFYVSFLTS